AQGVLAVRRERVVELVLAGPRHRLLFEFQVFYAQSVSDLLQGGFLTQVLTRADLVDRFRDIVVGGHVLVK
ncbi:MAG: hypothetical protein ACK56F_15685, partial [bacterium]